MKHVFLFLILITSLFGYSTHMVGGDIYYENVGLYEYKITVKLFFDCENGNPAAINTDRTITIGQFDAATNNFERSYEIRTRANRLTEIDDKLLYSCAIAKSTVCAGEYEYTRTVYINPGYEGKILAFERCCRNNTITNLDDPKNTGATFWVKIPGTRYVDQGNSSAIFNNLPPNYVCADAPFRFDHSATDADGDSLVYELYQPYDGASPDEPKPNRPAPPPYNKVRWRGGFSTAYQMASNPIFQIDRKTGEVKAHPNSETGQYVIGIRVLEFRDGKHIGTTMRDYQINVIECDFLLFSDFSINNASIAQGNTFTCEDSVSFTNTSLKAETYFWKFGDPTTKDDTSTLENPYWIYPGNGDYTVKLIVENSDCKDSIDLLVRVRSNIQIDLGPDSIHCHNVYQWLDATHYSATDWVWSHNKYGPISLVEQPGTYSVEVFYGQCVGSDTISIFLDTVSANVLKDSLFCDEVSTDVTINEPDLQVFWGDDITDNVKSKYFDQPQTVHYTVINENNCTRSDSVVLWVANKPEIGQDYFFCNEFELELDADSFREASYLWSDGSTNQTNTIRTAGEHWVQITQRHCSFSDTIQITNPVIDMELGENEHFCDDVDRILIAPAGLKSYLWSTNETTPEIQVNTPGTYFVDVTDHYDCTASDTIVLTRTGSPEIFIGDDTSVCLREQIWVGLEDDDFVSYEWSNGATTPNQWVSIPQSYWLRVVDDKGCVGRDTVLLTTDPFALPNDLMLPNAFSPNNDGLNAYFPFSETVIQPDYSCQIYSRWGVKMFDSETSKINIWDGKYQGKKVPGGVYMFVIRYRACNGEAISESGALHVVD